MADTGTPALAAITDLSVNFCFGVGGSSAIIFTPIDTVAVSAVDGAAVGECVGKGVRHS
jgi:hypothetical protein